MSQTLKYHSYCCSEETLLHSHCYVININKQELKPMQILFPIKYIKLWNQLSQKQVNMIEIEAFTNAKSSYSYIAS